MCFFVVTATLFALLTPHTSHAATVTWTGLGSDATCGGNAGDGNKWSCGANWSTSAVPAAADAVIFDATSTKAVSIAANISVTSIAINTGYTGTITQSAGVTITLSSTNANTAFSQAAGTFVGSSGTMTLSTGGFTLSGGSFTAPSGTLQIGRNFTVTAGTFLHNSGTVTFMYGTQSAVLSCGTATFNLVNFSKGISTSITVASDCIIPLAGTNPTSVGDIVNNGNISVTGNWSITGDYTSNAGAVLTMTGTTFTAESISLTGGTFPSGVTTLFANVSYADTGSVLHNGADLTLTQTVNGSLNCGTATFNSVTIQKSTGSTVTPTGSCTTNDFNLLTGTLANAASPYTFSIAGNLTINVSSASQNFGGANVLVVFNGSGNQYIIQNYGAFNSPFTVSKAAGKLSLHTDFYTASGQTCTVSQGTFALAGYDFVCGSTFSLASGTTLEAHGYEYFTVPAQSTGATISYIGRPDSIVQSFALRGLSYKNVTLNLSDATDIFDSRNILGTGLVGHWKMEAGSGSVDDSSVNSNLATLNGNASYSTDVPTLADESNTHSLAFDGSGDYLNMGGNLDTTQNTRGITFSAWIKKNTNASQDQIIGYSTNASNNISRAYLLTNAATLDCGARAADSETTQSKFTGSVLTTGVWYHVVCVIDYPNDKIAIYLNGVPQTATGVVSFTQDFTDNTTSLTSAIGIDEDKIGNDFDGLLDEVRVYNKALSATEVAALGTGYASSALTSPLSIAGNFTLTTGVLYPPAALSVAGNWTNTGTFNHNSGTVTLDGSNQSIFGETPFYNFTKQTSTADTLSFQATKVQTILGTLTLNGAASNVLSIFSNSNGTQWKIDPQGSRSISYLNVKDSNNISVTPIAVNGLNITDSGNNTNWSFSSGVPAISVTPLSPDPTASTTPSISGTVTDDTGTVALVEFQMDGTAGAWTACVAQDGSFNSASEAFTCTISSALSNGSHTIYIRATDNDSNVTPNAEAATDSFTVDITAPVISLTAYTPDPSSDASPTLSGTVTDAASNVQLVQYQINGTSGTWHDCGATDGTFSSSTESFSCTVSPDLSDGNYSVYVRGIDSLTNTGSGGALASDNFTIDITPPTIPGTPSATTGATDNTPTWQWARSTDVSAGLSATNAYTLEWSRSNTFSSGVSTTQVGTNNCSEATCTFTHSATLIDGTWYIRIKATDLVGNVSSYSTNGVLLVDATNPTISLTAISPDPGTETHPTLSGTATDSTSTIASVQYQVDSTSGTWSSCTATDGSFNGQSEAFTCTIATALTGGTHTIYTRATDSSGNITSNLLAYRDTYSVDIAAPSMSITPLSPNPTNDTTPTFSGTATDDTAQVSAVQYQVDGTGSTWRSCAATDGTFDEQSEAFTCTTTAQINGVHTLYVRSTDSAGNTTINASAVTASFTIDTVAPQITVTPLTPDPTSDTTPSLTGTVSDTYSSVATVQYQVNATGGSWSNCTADDGTFDEQSESFTCTVSSAQTDGTYTLYLRASDALGSTTANGAYSSDTFIIDTSTASISLNSYTPNPTTTQTPTMSGSVTDAVSLITSVEFQVDSVAGSWSSCTADDGTFDEQSETFTCTVSTTLSDGAHSLYVRATNDALITTANGSAPHISITVDTSAPAVTLTPISPDPTSDTTPTLTGTATDAYASITAVQYQADSVSGTWHACTATDAAFNELTENFTCTVSTALSDGAHTLYIKTTDSLGNTTTSSFTSDAFTVSTGTPAITVTPLSPDPSSDTTPSVTISATSQYSTVAALEYQVDVITGSWNTCIANDGTFDEASETATCTVAAALSQGAHTMYFRATNGIGSITPSNSLASDVFTIDTSAPLLTLNALAPDPNGDTTPTLSGTASDLYGIVANVSYQVDSTAGAWLTCAPNDSSFNSSSEQYNCTTDVLSYGTHTIYVRATDGLGNTTASGSYRSDVFTLNSTAPVTATSPTGSIAIQIEGNTNPTYTTSRSVTLTVSAFDTESATSLLSMRISENNSFTGSSWESFTTEKSFTLSEGDGTKRVYVQLKDPDELSSETYSDSVIFDQTAPTGIELLQPAADSATSQKNPLFQFKKATDLVSGVASYKVFVDDRSVFGDIPPTPPAGTSEIRTDSLLITYDDTTISVKSLQAASELSVGAHTWYVRVADAAGNSRSTATRTVTVDLTVPLFEVRSIGGDSQTITPTTPAGKIFTTTQQKPTFTGIAESGSHVVVSSESGQLCETTAAADGSWSCSATTPLTATRHTLTLTASDSAGNTVELPTVYVFVGYGTLDLSTSLTKSGDKIISKELAKHVSETDTAAEHVTELTETSGRSYDVKVVVKDTNGNPIEGAKVTLFSTPREGISDARGEVLFASVEEGEHTVVIDYNNSVGKRGVTIEGESKTIEVAVVVTERHAFFNPWVITLTTILVLTCLCLTWLLLRNRVLNRSKKVA